MVREERWTTFIKELNWRLHDAAVPMVNQFAIDHTRTKLSETDEWIKPVAENAIPQLKESLEQPFADELFLWQKDKSTLLNELDSVVRMPGWGNIWTQPIINRIDMLATGVNTMLGVRVFGDDINKISEKSIEIAAVLKKLRGAVDVSADQVVGEGYLEIDIDRERAARFGVNIGDIQDTIETALGRSRHHDDRRRPRAISGTHSICTSVSRRRTIGQEFARRRIERRQRHDRRNDSFLHPSDSGIQQDAAANSAFTSRRHSHRPRPVDDSQRERTAAFLRSIECSRPRHHRLCRRSASDRQLLRCHARWDVYRMDWPV